MREEWLDDEALSAAVGEWEANEQFDADRTELMLEQAAAGQVVPTGDDAVLFALAELLKLKGREPREDARQRAFSAMMDEADGVREHKRDPDRVEETHQALLKAFREQQAGGTGSAAS
ncbi:hypothetical protein [Streptomyces sp. NPDC059371]|uniref:hypothetical protein n=1 Tax=Streptomyces sp. NPDC059371 TaxID=3346812 RepID=UPI00369A3FB1